MQSARSSPNNRCTATTYGLRQPPCKRNHPRPTLLLSLAVRTQTPVASAASSAASPLPQPRLACGLAGTSAAWPHPRLPRGRGWRPCGPAAPPAPPPAPGPRSRAGWPGPGVAATWPRLPAAAGAGCCCRPLAGAAWALAAPDVCCCAAESRSAGAGMAPGAPVRPPSRAPKTCRVSLLADPKSGVTLIARCR